MHETRIDDEANDGAEHGRDQEAARIFIDPIHKMTMPGLVEAINSKLSQVVGIICLTRT
jgi:hypothetical protein